MKDCLLHVERDVRRSGRSVGIALLALGLGACAATTSDMVHVDATVAKPREAITGSGPTTTAAFRSDATTLTAGSPNPTPPTGAVGCTDSAAVFTLSKPLPLADAPTPGPLRCVDIESLLDKAVVWPPFRFAPDYHRSGSTTQPRTCREYRSLRNAGWSPHTTLDIEMETELVWTCDPLFALLKAKTPTRSYVPVDALDPALMTDYAEHPELALTEAIKQGIVRDVNVDTSTASLRYLTDCDPQHVRSAFFPEESRNAEGCGWEVVDSEFGRADINGDGYEDLIINTYSRRVAASMRGSSNLFAQRTSPTGIYETSRLASP